MIDDEAEDGGVVEKIIGRQVEGTMRGGDISWTSAEPSRGGIGVHRARPGAPGPSLLVGAGAGGATLAGRRRLRRVRRHLCGESISRAVRNRPKISDAWRQDDE